MMGPPEVVPPIGNKNALRHGHYTAGPSLKGAQWLRLLAASKFNVQVSRSRTPPPRSALRVIAGNPAAAARRAPAPNFSRPLRVFD